MDELERQENLHNLPGPYRSLVQEHSRVWQAYEALGKRLQRKDRWT